MPKSGDDFEGWATYGASAFEGLKRNADAYYAAMHGRCDCGMALTILGLVGRSGLGAPPRRTVKREGILFGAVEVLCSSRVSSPATRYHPMIALRSHTVHPIGWLALVSEGGMSSRGGLP